MQLNAPKQLVSGDYSGKVDAATDIEVQGKADVGHIKPGSEQMMRLAHFAQAHKPK